MNAETYDGWILYYSEEGYPYYYNEVTGDSQWADYHDSNEQQYQGHARLPEELTEIDKVFYHHQLHGNLNIYEAQGLNNQLLMDENYSDEDSSYSSLGSSVEEKFEMYLETEEGQAELKLEEERIAKRLEKRISRESLEREKLYILSLNNTKKETDDIQLSNSSGISNSGLKIVLFRLLGSVRNLFGVNQSCKSFKDKSSEAEFSSAGTRNFVDGRWDKFGRETKRRLLTYSNENVAISPRMTDAAPISDSNPSSDSEGKLSSDDSDVEIIHAPLLAELPTWKSVWSQINRLQPQVWPTVQNLASLVLAVLLKILVIFQAIQTFLNPFALRLLRNLSAKDIPGRQAE